MSVVVEGLEIEVRQKADKATDSIRALKKSLSELKTTVKTASSNFTTLANALEKVSQTTKDAKTSINTISQSISDSNKHLKESTQSVKDYNDNLKETKNIAKALESSDVSVPNANATATTNADTSNVPVKPIDLDAIKQMSEIEMLTRQLDGVNAKIEEISSKEPNSAKLVPYVKQWQKLNTELENAKFQSNGIVKTLNGLKTFMTTLFPKLSGLGRSVLRVGFYRAIRAVISGITTSIKEGVENAYQFSKIMGGEFVTTMDNINSEILEFKNQVGSVASEVIIAFEPAIVSALEKLISFADTLSQIMAVFNGDSTYKKANYVSEAWKDATDSVKAYKGQLLGVDELNNMTTSSSSSGSSTTSNAGLYYTYEPVTLSTKTQERIQWLKDNMDAIKEAIIVGGSTLALWKVSADVASALTKGGVLDQLKTFKLATGLILTVTGLTLDAVSSYKMATNGVDLKGIILSALGTAMAVGGLWLITGSLTTGLAIGIPLALTVSIIGWELGIKASAEQDFENSEFKVWLDEIQTNIDKSAELHLELSAGINMRDEAIQEIEDDALEVKSIIDRILYLSDKESLTTSELTELKGLVEDVNGMGIDGLQIELDKDNKLSKTKDDLYDIIQDLIAIQVQTEASEQLAETYLAQQKAIEEVTVASDANVQATDALETAKSNLANAESEYNDIIKNSRGSWALHLADLLGLSSRSKSAKENVEEMKIEVEKAQEKLDATSEALETANTDLEDVNRQYEFYIDALKDADGVAQDMLNSIDSTTEAFNDQKDSIDEVNSSLKTYNAFKTVDSSGKATVHTGSTGTYATGGFPTTGQLFIARESGAEMVGTIGNKTAVANNDQITSAIASATYNAMSQALAENNGSVNLVVEGDPNGMFKVMQKQASNYNKKTGRNAFA